jgi:chromosome segregation ATPase
MTTLNEKSIIEMCEKLQSDGLNPTQNAVRDALGGGSFATIAPVIKKWREQLNENEQLINIVIPASVETALSTLGGQLWRSATSEAEARMTSEREALASARDELDKERADYNDAIATLEKESESKDTKINEITQKLADADVEKDRLTTEKIALTAEIGKVEAVLTERLNGLQSRLDDAHKVIDKIEIKNRDSDL